MAATSHADAADQRPMPCEPPTAGGKDKQPNRKIGPPVYWTGVPRNAPEIQRLPRDELEA